MSLLSCTAVPRAGDARAAFTVQRESAFWDALPQAQQQHLCDPPTASGVPLDSSGSGGSSSRDPRDPAHPPCRTHKVFPSFVSSWAPQVGRRRGSWDCGPGVTTPGQAGIWYRCSVSEGLCASCQAPPHPPPSCSCGVTQRRAAAGCFNSLQHSPAPGRFPLL